VPPNDLRDHWCINVEVSNSEPLEGFNLLWYIRDVGDGQTSFDEFGQSGGFGATCASVPDPSGAFRPVYRGDIKTKLKYN
jgi:hypothetical protein